MLVFFRYNLLKIIQCYGEVENFEYLFHTIGPNKGEPRTYCFVEYKRKEVSNDFYWHTSGSDLIDIKNIEK
jgi:hypothetical protein